MSRFFALTKPIGIVDYASAGGPLEKQGPIGHLIDWTFDKDDMSEKTYEKSEFALYKCVVNGLLEKTGIDRNRIDYMTGGDLLNQIEPSNFSARDLQIPFLGIYGACSTFAQSLLINSMMLSTYGKYAISVTSSHFSTAERQFRYPLEFGNQRASTTQWTVTGAGAMLLTSDMQDVNITKVIIGRIVDLGVTDAANMGAAMAPAACDTIYNYFQLSNENPEDYDYIITGDLGAIGTDLLHVLLSEKGLDIKKIHIDCGLIIYGNDEKRNCGGSGCGCSALVMCAKILKEFKEKKIKKVFYAATGALLSTVSTLQGESIPSIVHGVCIEANGGNL